MTSKHRTRNPSHGHILRVSQSLCYRVPVSPQAWHCIPCRAAMSASINSDSKHMAANLYPVPDNMHIYGGSPTLKLCTQSLSLVSRASQQQRSAAFFAYYNSSRPCPIFVMNRCIPLCRAQRKCRLHPSLRVWSEAQPLLRHRSKSHQVPRSGNRRCLLNPKDYCHQGSTKGVLEQCQPQRPPQGPRLWVMPVSWRDIPLAGLILPALLNTCVGVGVCVWTWCGWVGVPLDSFPLIMYAMQKRNTIDTFELFSVRRSIKERAPT